MSFVKLVVGGEGGAMRGLWVKPNFTLLSFPSFYFFIDLLTLTYKCTTIQNLKYFHKYQANVNNLEE